MRRPRGSARRGRVAFAPAPPGGRALIPPAPTDDRAVQPCRQRFWVAQPPAGIPQRDQRVLHRVARGMFVAEHDPGGPHHRRAEAGCRLTQRIVVALGQSPGKIRNRRSAAAAGGRGRRARRV
jgi:hypothetical protein